MASKHYHHQLKMANDYVIPFLKKEIRLSTEMKILEVGCAESGLIKALVDAEMNCIGMELLQGRIDLAKEINPELELHQGDITDDELINKFSNSFDLIIIRDVIEHVPNQEKAFEVMNKLLKPGGLMYITFPPLYSPYAGHQQNLKGFFKKILWVHLLPSGLIKFLGRRAGVKEHDIEEVIHNGKIGLSISRFKRIYKSTGFKAVKKELFFSRPIYKIRWNWPVLKFPQIPLLQEVFATGCEYILIKP